MVATWFPVSSFTWKWRAKVLYLCTCGTTGLYFTFRCVAGGIGFVPSRMMGGLHWCGRIGLSTLGGVTG